MVGFGVTADAVDVAVTAGLFDVTKPVAEVISGEPATNVSPAAAIDVAVLVEIMAPLVLAISTVLMYSVYVTCVVKVVGALSIVIVTCGFIVITVFEPKY